MDFTESMDSIFLHLNIYIYRDYINYITTLDGLTKVMDSILLHLNTYIYIESIKMD